MPKVRETLKLIIKVKNPGTGEWLIGKELTLQNPVEKPDLAMCSCLLRKTGRTLGLPSWYSSRFSERLSHRIR